MADLAGEVWIEGRDPACAEPLRVAAQRRRLRAEDLLRVGAVAGQAGPRRGRGRRHADPDARARERARRHRAALARPRRPAAEDRARHARLRLRGARPSSRCARCCAASPRSTASPATRGSPERLTVRSRDGDRAEGPGARRARGLGRALRRRRPSARRRSRRCRASRSGRCTRRRTCRPTSTRRSGCPGEYPFTRGVYPSMYRGRLWTMRQFAGFGTAEETNERFRYLLDHGQTGLSTAFDMPIADGLRLRPRALARRGRPRGRRDRHARRHGDAVRRASTSAQVSRVDDDQRAGGDHDGLLRRRGGGEGRAARPPRRHDPGRHPQGVHRPEGVVLPGRPGDAPARRHDRVVREGDAALASRSRSAATTSARRARRPRRSSRSRSRTASPTSSRRSTRGLDVDDFAPRLSFFFNAHIDFFEEIAKYRAARRIWARELRDTFGAQQPEVVADAHARADRGRLADRPAAAQQHHPHRDRGARRRARRHAVAAHQLLGRGARAADRERRADRAAHPADHRPRDRRDEHDRPARRLVLRRGADRRDRGAGLRLLRQDRRAGRDGRGGQARLPAARDRRRRLHAAAGVRLAGADHGRRQRLHRGRGRRARAASRRPGDRAQADRPRAGRARAAATARRSRPRSPSCARPRRATPT